jgi:hypothetical protein
MRTIGTYLLMFGVGTFALHAMGMEFRLMRVFGESQNLAAGVMAALGLVLFVLGKPKAEATE